VLFDEDTVAVTDGSGALGLGAARAEPASGPATARVATTDVRAVAAVARSEQAMRIREISFDGSRRSLGAGRPQHET
jgi:hypothetical protein